MLQLKWCNWWVIWLWNKFALALTYNCLCCRKIGRDSVWSWDGCRIDLLFCQWAPLWCFQCRSPPLQVDCPAADWLSIRIVFPERQTIGTANRIRPLPAGSPRSAKPSDWALCVQLPIRQQSIGICLLAPGRFSLPPQSLSPGNTRPP